MKSVSGELVTVADLVVTEKALQTRLRALRLELYATKKLRIALFALETRKP